MVVVVCSDNPDSLLLFFVSWLGIFDTGSCFCVAHYPQNSWTQHQKYKKKAKRTFEARWLLRRRTVMFLRVRDLDWSWIAFWLRFDLTITSLALGLHRARLLDLHLARIVVLDPHHYIVLLLWLHHLCVLSHLHLLHLLLLVVLHPSDRRQKVRVCAILLDRHGHTNGRLTRDSLAIRLAIGVEWIATWSHSLWCNVLAEHLIRCYSRSAYLGVVLPS